MATTTNYGWTTPDDTALVKDGASAIRTLGSSVDTTTKALNPSTTLGDIEYRSSTANTNTRLGIGTTGQVLTVTGGVPVWAAASAGGMTLISTTTLTGASVTLSSIPQTYNSLFLVIYGVTNATADSVFGVEANAAALATYSAVTNGTAEVNNNSLRISGAISPLRTDANNCWQVRFDNYTSTTNYKAVSWSGVYISAGPVNTAITGGGGFKSNTAISSIELKNYGGNLSTGTVLLYGVK
jgi:hypothetical protein